MDQFDVNHEAYVSSPEYPRVMDKARAQGFRKATPAEVRASAEKRTGYPNLFCAYGGLWARQKEGAA